LRYSQEKNQFFFSSDVTIFPRPFPSMDGTPHPYLIPYNRRLHPMLVVQTASNQNKKNLVQFLLWPAH